MNGPRPAKRKKLVNYCDTEFLLELGKLDYSHCAVMQSNHDSEVKGEEEECNYLLREEEEGQISCDRRKRKCKLLNYGDDVNSSISLRGVTNELHQFILGSRGLFVSEWTSPEGPFGDLLQLIMAGMDVNIPVSFHEKGSNPPLHVTILQGQQEQYKGKENAEPVMMKSMANAYEKIRDILVDLLLDAGEGEVNCSNFEDNEQEDPLHFRVLNSKMNIIKILLEFGTDTNTSLKVVNKEKRESSLVYPSKDIRTGGGERGVMSSLLSSGSEVNSSFDKGRKPLHKKFTQRLLHSIKVLLFNGHKVNLIENFNTNPLHVSYYSAGEK